MKSILILFVLSAAGLGAAEQAKEDQTKKTAKKPKPATAAVVPAPAPAEIKIPEGAVPTDDGSFKFTDAQGKKWIYRNTPFGVAKSEDKPAPVVKQEFNDPTIAYEEGDSIRFEKPTPFGIVKWKKKKDDLDDTERKIVERQSGKQ